MKHYIYILTNPSHTIYYTGMTTNLKQRLQQHRKEKHNNAFTAQYNIKKLVYFETKNSQQEASERELQIKRWSQEQKRALIESANPYHEDLGAASNQSKVGN